MRLGYFTMPVHPIGRDWSQTLREDREAVILADRLGFYDAFVGEHLTDVCENITNSMMFHATLISETKTIKLATGTTNLSHMHPVLIAVHAAMFDHLAQGRFILGVSAGALSSDAEAIGLLDQDRNKIFAEAIDVILAIWEREPPYDIDFPDNRFKVAINRAAALHLGVGIMAKPLQKPRPEIVGTVVAPFSPGVVLMGKRDFHPLSANFLLAKHLKSHWTNYAKGKAEAGQQAEVADWRVARTIFVADDEATALRYARSRHSTSDFDRSRRQQRVLRAMVARAREKGLLRSAPGLLASLHEHVQTDLNLAELLGLGLLAARTSDLNVRSGGLDFHQLRDWTTPEGAMVLLADPAAVAAKLDQVLSGADPAAAGPAGTVALVDHTGRDGWDRVATTALVERRIPVAASRLGAAEPGTRLYYRAGDEALAAQVAEALGIPASERAALDELPPALRLGADVQVVLGDDWAPPCP